MKMKWIICFLGLCSSTTAFSQECLDVINEFRNIPRGQPLTNFYFPRYEGKLGQPIQINTVDRQWYSWGSYRALVKDGQIIRTEGYRPLGISAHPTLNELIYILRYPVTEPIQHMTQYTWRCGPEGSNTTLSLTVDTDKNIVGFAGVYCDPANPSDCVSFGSD